MKKYARQSKILELIENNEIETQEELADYLKKLGIDVTQATVSRDIRELRLIKVLAKSGKYKYAAMGQNVESTTDRLIKIFKNSIVSINIAGHLLVIKTLPGAAQICGSAVDSLGLDEIAGTIAGDDTIFIAVSDINKINDIRETFQKLLN
ncbi:transcriptional regulator, ArgR family [Proteiniborus ethanoligenes]|uniref:Arginine repressor n=1 Tax=Proteiniborus ethanoligenes TaxID=415015 RepID=A0A1H3K928_9FIRM|nr:arginine repressor [Proteiniborus ethanoligenes]TAH62449.1 MAG: arginine repressor [Gottschalkiaceae bacterium]SDY48682.1 transcriptional regulator, ArgR family [Proteiniborus ethanoligenes]